MKKFFTVLLLVGIGILPAAATAKTMTVEAEATSLLSPEAEIVTYAAAPVLGVAATGREGELRVSLGVDGDPASTQYAVKEVSGNKFVNPRSGVLQTEPVWGAYEDWGSGQGIIAMVGSVPDPRFVSMAKNLAGEITAASGAVTLSGRYRASREPVEVITEAVVYGIGVLVFAGLAVYQFRRMRKPPAKKRRK